MHDSVVALHAAVMKAALLLAPSIPERQVPMRGPSRSLLMCLVNAIVCRLLLSDTPQPERRMAEPDWHALDRTEFSQRFSCKGGLATGAQIVSDSMETRKY